MHVLFIVDKDTKTPLSRDLQGKLTALLEDKGNALEILEVGADEAVPCLGCLLCVTKGAGVGRRGQILTGRVRFTRLAPRHAPCAIEGCFTRKQLGSRRDSAASSADSLTVSVLRHEPRQRAAGHLLRRSGSRPLPRHARRHGRALRLDLPRLRRERSGERSSPPATRSVAKHYHLLIEASEPNLSRGMRHLNGVYTQAFNIRGIPQ